MTTPGFSADRPLRVGVVGVGWAGQQHLDRYLARPDVEIVGIAGMEAEVLAALAAEHDIPLAVPDWQTLLEQGELDAISVAVPTFLHAPIAIAALDAGVHVLSEKPMARTAEEANAMVAAARRAGRVLQVAFNQRHRGDLAALAEQVASGALGRVYHARASWLRRAGIPTLGSWFTNREMAGGGPLIDLGVHVLDATLRIMGEPRVLTVSAVTHSELGPRGLGGSGSDKQAVGSAYEVEDFATVLLRLEGGASITLESSWATHRPSGDEIALTLYGTDGGADVSVVDYALTPGRYFGTAPDGEADLELEPLQSGGHAQVVDEFLDAIADPASWAEHDGSLGASRTRIIDAAYRSAEAGTEVKLDDDARAPLGHEQEVGA
ncbi:Gfo/Idh/MocA family protein [Pseudactinotalea sp.]|uniref:Gfo/Idh/MocA family protein n=1 Tax=Pseudactinotalea sp. TaxID=1926260 RepID=UPI003B3A0E30